MQLKGFCSFQLEVFATQDAGAVSSKELLNKLKLTESELEKWQTLQREQIYQSGNCREWSDAEVTLRCLGDALFHYLTEQKNPEQYLALMIKVFGFTEAQMKSIVKALSGDKKKLRRDI